MIKPEQKQTISTWINSLILIFILLLLFSPKVSADNLWSDSYDIDMSTINITGGNKTSDSYKLGDTVGQTFQGQFDSSGYTILAGFQYIHSITAFTFTISDLSIDFGSLTPQSPSTATNTLTVTSGAAFGYSVKAIANHPLQVGATSTQIPDTACDPATSCTISDADVWSSGSAYGFGYNMSGQDINLSDFVDSTYYRPFADASDSDSPAIVMENSAATRSATSTVTYKVNVSSIQEAGKYQNVIQFIALPSF